PTGGGQTVSRAGIAVVVDHDVHAGPDQLVQHWRHAVALDVELHVPAQVRHVAEQAAVLRVGEVGQGAPPAPLEAHADDTVVPQRGQLGRVSTGVDVDGAPQPGVPAQGGDRVGVPVVEQAHRRDHTVGHTVP